MCPSKQLLCANATLLKPSRSLLRDFIARCELSGVNTDRELLSAWVNEQVHTACYVSESYHYHITKVQ